MSQELGSNDTSRTVQNSKTESSVSEGKKEPHSKTAGIGPIAQKF